jgi:hypothetical protein
MGLRLGSQVLGLVLAPAAQPFGAQALLFLTLRIVRLG